MRDYQDKINRDGQPDSITATKFGAGEFDSLATENKTAVERAGLTLAPANGTGEDTTQLAQSLFINSVKSMSFQDSGAANAYVLTPVSGANGVLLPSDYAPMDGARVSFVPSNSNTGAATVNMGQTAGTLLGSKNLLSVSSAALSGGEIVGGVRTELVYSAAADGGSGAWILVPWAAATSDVGSIVAFAGTSAPADYVKANGALLNRASFPQLWEYANSSGNIAASDGAWVKGEFSPGNGSTTFRVPDYRGEFMRAWNDDASIDTGRAIGSAQADLFKLHRHPILGWASSGFDPDGGAAAVLADTNGTNLGNQTNTVRDEGGTETRPRNLAALFCIRYR